MRHSEVPYETTSLGGAYGGYLPQVAEWESLTSCPHVLLSQNGADGGPANADASDGAGEGEVAVYVLGGPGADPDYNATVSEARHWGEVQGNAAAVAAQSTTLGGGASNKVIFGDMEQGNGWNSLRSCSRTARTIPPAVDAATIDGFDAALSAAGFDPGIYSSYDFWNDTTFGCGTACGTGAGHLSPSVYEWTYQTQTATPSSSSKPDDFCLDHGSGPCAGWFGGNGGDPPEGLIWQWAANNESANYGDFDQIDAANWPTNSCPRCVPAVTKGA